MSTDLAVPASSGEPPAALGFGEARGRQRSMATDRTAALWSGLSERIRAMHDVVMARVPGDDPALAAEGLRYLTRFLAAGIDVCVAHDDTLDPELGRMTENRMSWGMDNPDCLYTYARVAGDGAYRISGHRGSACNIEFQVNTGHFGDGNFSGWQAIGALNGDDLATGPDGAFELVLGGAPRARNHLPLGEQASFLLIRQYFDDWERERPADLFIERTDVTLPSPPLTMPDVEAHLAVLGTWLETGARCWADLGAAIASAEPGPITPFVPPASASGLKGQAYGMGAFRCEPDEAVVLELTPPACRMWSVSLADLFWQSLEIATRQTSLNGTQAAADDDGVVRVVLARRDPGVWNWLDAGAHGRGTLALRYLMAETIPTMRYETVPFDEVAARLPATTRRCTPAERDRALRRRARQVAARYRR